MIKNKILIPLAFLLSFGMSLTDANASHIVGGEMTYRCLGNNTFEVTLTIYRDCFFGNPLADFDDPAWIAIFKDGGLAQGVSDDGVLTVAPPAPFDTLREILTSECFVQGDPVCVERAVHTTYVQLPYSETGYILSYQRCCRNQTIRNIIDPDQTGANIWCYVPAEATLTQDEVCNSNPVFNDFPPIYICTDEDINFDHSATDEDGDELRYRLCTPNDALSFSQPQVESVEQFDRPEIGPIPFEPVVFSAGYELDNLLGGTGAAMRIDPVTGLLTGIPTEVGQYLVGVCVGEYRNGVLLSETRRDFQFNVRSCSDAPIASFDADEFNCESLTVDFTNTSSGDFYGWDFGDMTTSTEVNPSHTYAMPGTYTVMLTSYIDSTCLDTTTATITVNSIVQSLILDDEYNTCAGGGTITANAQSSIPSIVEWSFSADFSSIEFTGSTFELPDNVTNGQVVYARVVDENGCTVVDQATISTSLPEFEVILSSYNLCNTGVSTITATIPSTVINPIVQWSLNANFDPIVFTGTEFTIPEIDDGTVVYVQVTGANGCVIRDSTTITTTIEDFDIVLDSYNLCTGDFTTITANVPSTVENPIVEWSYSDSFDPIIFTGLAFEVPNDIDNNQTVYVRVRSSNGCEITDQTTIINTIDVDVIADSYDICSGITEIMANVPGGLVNPVVEWSFSGDFDPIDFTGETFPLPNDIDDNTILYVRISTDNGCTISDQTNLTGSMDNSGFTTNGSQCGNLTVSFDYLGDDADNVSWDFGDNTSSDMIDPDHTYGTSGTYSVVLIVGEGLCATPITVDVTVIGTDIIPPNNETVRSCDGQNVTLNPGGSSDFVYVWSPSDFLDDDSSPSPTASVTQTTTFTVMVSDPNDADCFITEMVTLVVSPIADLDLGDIQSCNMDQITLNSNGDPTLSYEWSPADLFDGQENEASPTITVTGEEDISVTVSDDSLTDCTRSFNFTVSQIPEYDVTVDESPVQCPDEMLDLSVIDNDMRALMFKWYDADFNLLSTDPNFMTTIDANSMFNLIICNEDGICPDTTAIDAILDMEIPVDVEVANDRVFCMGDEVTLNITSDIPAGATIQWNPPAAGNGTSTTITATSTMNISATVTSALGCSFTGSAQVEVSTFQVGASTNPGCVMEPDEVVQLNANGGAVSYSWSADQANVIISDPNIQNPTATNFTQTTRLTVTVVDENGCTFEGMTTVQVEEDCNPPCLTNDNLPNLFSPNGDNINDLYTLVYSPASLIEMFIYDRWGNEVFNTTSSMEFWDGFHDGDAKPQDVYGYLIIATCPDGREIEVRGNVTLFR